MPQHQTQTSMSNIQPQLQTQSSMSNIQPQLQTQTSMSNIQPQLQQQGNVTNFNKDIQMGATTKTSRMEDLRDTAISDSTFQQGSLSHTQTANYNQITVIDRKLIVEKVAETHFETQYIQKTVSVPTPVQNEVTLVTAIQETRRVPVTKLVEVIESVPIKVVEEVVEYKTIPVTKFEEVIEQVPVKKFVQRIEYKKVPCSKLVERTEHINVKRVEEKIEYVTITTTNPINPVPLDSYKEQNTGIIESKTQMFSSTGTQQQNFNK